MDKTIEIVMVVTVLLMTAVAIMFMVSDRAGNFGQWANDTQQGASCDLYQTNYELACNCDAENGQYETQEAAEAYSKAESESCTWVTEGFTCSSNVCS